MDTVVSTQKTALTLPIRHNYHPRVIRVPAWLQRVWSWL